MARRGGPALYELLDKSKGSVPSGAIPASARLDPKAVQSLVLAAVVLAAIVTAYLVGVSRGAVAERKQAEAGGNASEPLRRGQSSNGVASGSSVEGAQQPSTPENRASASDIANAGAGSAPNVVTPVSEASGGSLGPPQAGDPRQSGRSYFVLCSTLEPNALKVVDFCRSKGLDAYVVPDQNGRLREVTVLPGFEAGERSSPAIKELEERVRKVGVLWKASGPGNSDFGDRYIKTHR